MAIRRSPIRQIRRRCRRRPRPTIGDLLSAKGISWAWYGGAWQATLDGQKVSPAPVFQYHHQPFNYFAAMAPGTAARAEHLRDGGLDGVEFIKAIDAGSLPQVTFYKPQGNLNEHAGYAAVLAGDQHIADVIAHLEKSPQWRHMLVVVTYDENGGFWDHVAPPKGDRWGPGSRVPTLIVSPFARRHYVDHTQYDTTSILRFITRRFGLPQLAGNAARDAALKSNGCQADGRSYRSARAFPALRRAGCATIALSPSGQTAVSREPDPSSAPRHPEPQTQRYERRELVQQRSIGGRVRLRHAAANRERKKEQPGTSTSSLSRTAML